MQVYVVVWQWVGPHRMVLVGKKKVRGARFEGRPTLPSILNYAGQWVFPGGGKKTGERPQDAARREFFEETGHRLRWDVVGAHYEQPDHRHGILYVQSANIELMATRINDNLLRGATQDDELECVRVFTHSYALALFSVWSQQDEDVEDELRRRDEKYYKDRSWFTDALNVFP